MCIVKARMRRMKRGEEEEDACYAYASQECDGRALDINNNNNRRTTVEIRDRLALYSSSSPPAVVLVEVASAAGERSSSWPVTRR